MVDVSEKASTAREAVAEGRLIIAAETAQLIREERTPKGAVLTTAEIAGIMAAKRTADLIPMCHPLALTSVKVLTTLEDSAVRVEARVKTTGQTGVEMEALTAVTIACLTLYDMLKAVDFSMRIEGVALVSKTGGSKR
jgi:cyclic pyranopterin phosphate synthase